MFYNGKKVLITGAANGIGAQIATGYARLGATVIAVDKDYRGEPFVAQQLLPISPQSAFFHADLSGTKVCEELMQRIFEQYDDVDIIINCAACTDFALLCDATPEQWDYTIGTNLRAPFLIAQAYAKNRALKNYRDRYGRIVNIASSRFMMSEEGTEAYTASKGGLVSLTHALAISLSAYNTTVNCISPGWICTADYDNLRYSDHRQHPSGRVGTPADVLKACLYCTDEQNDFLNGQNIVLDGAMGKKMIYID